MASMAYSTWNSLPSGLNVLTPLSYSLLVRNMPQSRPDQCPACCSAAPPNCSKRSAKHRSRIGKRSRCAQCEISFDAGSGKGCLPAESCLHAAMSAGLRRGRHLLKRVQAVCGHSEQGTGALTRTPAALAALPLAGQHLPAAIRSAPLALHPTACMIMCGMPIAAASAMISGICPCSYMHISTVHWQSPDAVPWHSSTAVS